MRSALGTTVSVMGAWMGLAGIEHGIGELLQGNTAGGAGMIYSWPDSPFFASLGGEPAFTVLTGMLPTGIMALVTSLIFVGFCVLGREHRWVGVWMMAAAVPMFLFGGGIFPPILGFILGLALVFLRGERMRHVTSRFEKLAGHWWKAILTACILAWLVLLPGVPLLGYLGGVDDPVLILAVIASAFLLLGLSFWSAALRDRIAPGSSTPAG